MIKEIIETKVTKFEKDKVTEVEKKIEKHGNKWWVVHCHGAKAGQKISEHNTYEEALAAHRAMEANKVKKMVNESGEVSKFVPLCKVHVEKRIVTGIVLEPDTVDLQGDIYDADTIEESAHDFLRDVRQMGFMHKQFDKQLSVVESFIAPVDFKLEGKPICKGTWVLSAKVLDNDIWESIKKNQITGFSIGAVAQYDNLDNKGE